MESVEAKAPCAGRGERAGLTGLASTQERRSLTLTSRATVSFPCYARACTARTWPLLPAAQVDRTRCLLDWGESARAGRRRGATLQAEKGHHAHDRFNDLDVSGLHSTHRHVAYYSSTDGDSPSTPTAKEKISPRQVIVRVMRPATML
jgi:hypothetical protein